MTLFVYLLVTAYHRSYDVIPKYYILQHNVHYNYNVQKQLIIKHKTTYFLQQQEEKQMSNNKQSINLLTKVHGCKASHTTCSRKLFYLYFVKYSSRRKIFQMELVYHNGIYVLCYVRVSAEGQDRTNTTMRGTSCGNCCHY
jgi:hypothetical protein